MVDSGISHSMRQGEVFSFPTVFGIERGRSQDDGETIV